MSVRSIVSDVESIVTLDGSAVRELMHPAVHGNHAQSLAQASVAPGEKTRRHFHRRSEELYHVLKGSGMLHLDEEEIPVCEGHTVLIPPGTHHFLVNSGTEDLIFLCCCSPAYSDSDTFFP